MGEWFFAFSLQDNLHAHKIPFFWGGGILVFFFGGGGSADFIFMGARIFWFFRVIAFLQHAPNKSSASKMEGFPQTQNSRETAQIANGQKIGSMHVKRSDPEKD